MSGVMRRRPARTSLIRWAGTWMADANAFWDSSKSSRKSASRPAAKLDLRLRLLPPQSRPGRSGQWRGKESVGLYVEQCREGLCPASFKTPGLACDGSGLGSLRRSRHGRGSAAPRRPARRFHSGGAKRSPGARSALVQTLRAGMVLGIAGLSRAPSLAVGEARPEEEPQLPESERGTVQGPWRETGARDPRRRSRALRDERNNATGGPSRGLDAEFGGLGLGKRDERAARLDSGKAQSEIRPQRQPADPAFSPGASEGTA